jgi:hypothetical protein
MGSGIGDDWSTRTRYFDCLLGFFLRATAVIFFAVLCRRSLDLPDEESE